MQINKIDSNAVRGLVLDPRRISILLKSPLFSKTWFHCGVNVRPIRIVFPDKRLSRGGQKIEPNTSGGNAERQPRCCKLTSGDYLLAGHCKPDVTRVFLLILAHKGVGWDRQPGQSTKTATEQIALHFEILHEARRRGSHSLE